MLGCMLCADNIAISIGVVMPGLQQVHQLAELNPAEGHRSF